MAPWKRMDDGSLEADGTTAPRRRETPGLDGSSSEVDWATDPWQWTAGQILRLSGLRKGTPGVQDAMAGANQIAGQDRRWGYGVGSAAGLGFGIQTPGEGEGGAR